MKQQQNQNKTTASKGFIFSFQVAVRHHRKEIPYNFTCRRCGKLSPGAWSSRLQRSQELLLLQVCLLLSDPKTDRKGWSQGSLSFWDHSGHGQFQSLVPDLSGTGRAGSRALCRFSDIPSPVAHSVQQELKHRSQRSEAYWLLHTLLNLFSYIIQDHLPRGGIAHKRAGPSHINHSSRKCLTAMTCHKPIWWR